MNEDIIHPQYNPNDPLRYSVDDPRYESKDMPEKYGSIIKDLTDTDDMLRKFEARLRGKIVKDNGDIDIDSSQTAYIKTDQAARDYIDLIRSIVNRHNDFSYYEPNEAFAIVEGAAATLNRWLMLQGKDVPTRYRAKIAFEGMALISASLHKAMNGRILVWTKGTFKEGMNISQSPQKKSVWDYIIPWRKKS